MNSQVTHYLGLRVYRHLSIPSLLNFILCNRLMRIPFIANNATKLFFLSNKILGKTLTNKMTRNIFCQSLTAGNSLHSAKKTADYYRLQNISIILDYCAQGSQDASQVTLDANADMFLASSNYMIDYVNEMTAIKITGLISLSILKSINNAIQFRNKFWQMNSKQGQMTMTQLFNGLQQIYSGITEKDIEQYLKQIYNYEGEIQNFKLDEIEFKMKHYPYYIYCNNNNKNKNLIIRLFLPLCQNQQQKLINFKERIKNICQPYKNNTNNFKILIDAQQTYLQNAIQCISQQMQLEYNTQQLYIISTIQNYLKQSNNRIQYEIQFTKRNKLYFGCKLVRGAYMIEQQKLSKQNNYQNPIVNNFNLTSINYLNNFQSIIKNKFIGGQIIIATHNQQTIRNIINIYNLQNNHHIKISFAQLMGLADHLTCSLKQSQYHVYKYLPWASTQIMIAYMLRRAEQLSQARYPLKIQNTLLKHELRRRIYF